MSLLRKAATAASATKSRRASDSKNIASGRSTPPRGAVNPLLDSSLDQTSETSDKTRRESLTVPDAVLDDILAGDQGLNGRIEVTIRLKGGCDEPQTEKLAWGDASEYGVGGVAVYPATRDQRIFKYDNVLSTDACQERVYEVVGKPMVEFVLQGFTGTILCYGQTGAGKTYTMLEPEGVPTINLQSGTSGLIPRVLFQVLEAKNKKTVLNGLTIGKIEIGVFEIYNKSVRDLISGQDKMENYLHETPQGTWEFMEMGKAGYKPMLATHSVEDMGSALVVLRAAMNSRQTKAHKMNQRSSRSHMVVFLQVNLESSADPKTGHCNSIPAKLYLVDLAGSERLAKTESTGDRMIEGCHVNASLSSLITAIHEVGKARGLKQNPGAFRTSVLTKVLKHAFGGNSKTHLVANCSPLDSELEETKSTLVFAHIAKRIVNSIRRNKHTAVTISDLKTELVSTHTENSMLRSLLVQRDAQTCRLKGELTRVKALLYDLTGKRWSENDIFSSNTSSNTTPNITPGNTPGTTPRKQSINLVRSFFTEALSSDPTEEDGPKPNVDPLPGSLLRRKSFEPGRGSLDGALKSRQGSATGESRLGAMSPSAGISAKTSAEMRMSTETSRSGGGGEGQRQGPKSTTSMSINRSEEQAIASSTMTGAYHLQAVVASVCDMAANRTKSYGTHVVNSIRTMAEAMCNIPLSSEASAEESTIPPEKLKEFNRVCDTLLSDCLLEADCHRALKDDILEGTQELLGNYEDEVKKRFAQEGINTNPFASPTAPLKDTSRELFEKIRALILRVLTAGGSHPAPENGVQGGSAHSNLAGVQWGSRRSIGESRTMKEHVARHAISHSQRLLEKWHSTGGINPPIPNSPPRLLEKWNSSGGNATPPASPPKLPPFGRTPSQIHLQAYGNSHQVAAPGAGRGGCSFSEWCASPPKHQEAKHLEAKHQEAKQEAELCEACVSIVEAYACSVCGEKALSLYRHRSGKPSFESTSPRRHSSSDSSTLGRSNIRSAKDRRSSCELWGEIELHPSISPPRDTSTNAVAYSPRSKAPIQRIPTDENLMSTQEVSVTVTRELNKARRISGESAAVQPITPEANSSAADDNPHFRQMNLLELRELGAAVQIGRNCSSVIPPDSDEELDTVEKKFCQLFTPINPKRTPSATLMNGSKLGSKRNSRGSPARGDSFSMDFFAVKRDLDSSADVQIGAIGLPKGESPNKLPPSLLATTVETKKERGGKGGEEEGCFIA